MKARSLPHPSEPNPHLTPEASDWSTTLAMAEDRDASLAMLMDALPFHPERVARHPVLQLEVVRNPVALTSRREPLLGILAGCAGAPPSLLALLVATVEATPVMAQDDTVQTLAKGWGRYGGTPILAGLLRNPSLPANLLPRVRRAALARVHPAWPLDDALANHQAPPEDAPSGSAQEVAYRMLASARVGFGIAEPTWVGARLPTGAFKHLADHAPHLLADMLHAPVEELVSIFKASTDPLLRNLIILREDLPTPVYMDLAFHALNEHDPNRPEGLVSVRVLLDNNLLPTEEAAALKQEIKHRDIVLPELIDLPSEVSLGWPTQEPFLEDGALWHVSTLMTSAHPGVLVALLLGYRLRPEVLVMLAHHPSRAVRLACTLRDSLPEEAVRRLSSDADAGVRRAVQEAVS